MARPKKEARKWEGWQFLVTVAIRTAAVFLDPLLDHWYGGNGSGRP